MTNDQVIKLHAHSTLTKQALHHVGNCLGIWQALVYEEKQLRVRTEQAKERLASAEKDYNLELAKMTHFIRETQQ